MREVHEINATLNGICPYFTMFPLDFPLRTLRSRAQSNDVVLDPFCGRGTTNYASRLIGLNNVGIDSSPVAVAISQSKLANAAPEKIVEMAKIILESTKPKQIPEGEFWSLAYDNQVLRDICKIRENLLNNDNDDLRNALRGIMLGALHGPPRKQGSSYFSNQSQRTYAPKPNYAINFWKSKGLVPGRVSVIDIIENRAYRYYKNQKSAKGKVIRGDSRLPKTFSSIKTKVHWIITSPPYYGMRTYLPDQWLRLWFLGGRSEVDYSANEQLRHSSRDDFVSDLKSVWSNIADVCHPDAQLVIRFGKIHDRNVDPIEIIKASFTNTPWKCKTIKSAGSAAKGHRQVKHMAKSVAVASEEFDIWAGLS